MCFHVLLLKTPVSSSKRLKNSPASVKSKIRFKITAKNELPWSVEAFPGLYCPPTQCCLASAVVARSSCPTAGAEIRSKCYS